MLSHYEGLTPRRYEYVAPHAGLMHLLAQPKNSRLPGVSKGNRLGVAQNGLILSEDGLPLHQPAGANSRLPGVSKGNRLPSPASLRRDRRRSSTWTHFERRRVLPLRGNSAARGNGCCASGTASCGRGNFAAAPRGHAPFGAMPACFAVAGRLRTVYFLRRRAARAASASMLSVVEVGSGM